MGNNKKAKQKYWDRVYAEAPMVECACGCGEMTKAMDHYARPRRYIANHFHGKKYDDPKEYKRAWNRRNKEGKKLYRRKHRQKKKAAIIIDAGGVCLCCGLEYDGKNACVFDFHHRDPDEKEFGLNCDFSLGRLLTEVEKCDILCGNCHRTLHADEY